jgi:hypothetical protein
MDDEKESCFIGMLTSSDKKGERGLSPQNPFLFAWTATGDLFWVDSPSVGINEES